MQSLAELQDRVRQAVTGGDATALASLLAGGGRPERRLAIHRRHHQTSLVNALLQKFPATAWLIGTRLLTDAAARFVHAHPPTAPCIADYGAQFPEFLAALPETAHLPYLQDFSALEWHLGHIAVAIEEPHVEPRAIAARDLDRLPDLTLGLQPGLCYLCADWPVDELMQLFLSDTAPDSFTLDQGEVWLELRGSRGTFGLSRLPPGVFAFRSALADGSTVGVAAHAASQIEDRFDLAAAFSAVIANGLIAAIAGERRQ